MARKQPPQTHKVLGTCGLGYENVRVIVRYDSGDGAFYLQPDGESTGIIEVGLEQECWHEVFNVLLHEAMEYALTRRSCRYVVSGTQCTDASDFLFQFNHPEFSRVVSDVAAFVAEAQGPVQKEFEKHRRRSA